MESHLVWVNINMSVCSAKLSINIYKQCIVLTSDSVTVFLTIQSC